MNVEKKMLRKQKQVSDRTYADCAGNRNITGIHNSLLYSDYDAWYCTDNSRDMVYKEKVSLLSRLTDGSGEHIFCEQKGFRFYAGSSGKGTENTEGFAPCYV